MATSVHIPQALLEAVDRRARQLRVSRNRLIVTLVEEGIAKVTEWSSGFFERLSAGAADRSAVDQMLEAIRANRTRKRPPTL